MRRRWLLTAPLGAAACSVLPQRSYVERRDWPLAVPRPATAPHRPASRLTLLVRAVAAGPGLEGRGLQSLQPDGSIATDYYEQWVVPPAQAVEAALRQWLVAAGLFAAVLAPGSRAPADWVLEGELLALDTGPGGARAVLSCALLDERAGGVRVLWQDALTGTAAIAGAGPQALVAAMQAALADAFGRVEQRLAESSVRS